MKLLILGASGGVGQWLTRLAAERGHDVTALIRPAASLEVQPGVRIARGNVLDEKLLASLVRGQDAVASCLGLRRGGQSPWAPLESPPDFVENVTRALVGAMDAAGVRRLVAISAGGVGDSREQLTPIVRWLVSRGNVAVAYRDLLAMETLLRASALDWLAVRPVTLVHGEPNGRARPVSTYRATSTVRRSDVAAFMLTALERPTPFVEHTVLLGTGPRQRPS